ncbi:adenylate/guanylate cyclase domain-containing protein [Parasedimentitalea marina]|uniref:Adenylate/guanylate cyclase domain-containing protein n=1 Tax=Parasedimentitalea marina TaxID=2483033 RepID=A0A3T0N957_9RHOB|nr:adenylate/guanylate cyclase domain-containing protein [Parasedimentitalea marina]AZV80485.1 adenylate/guanylate cyclase domain-containing protein [Parasedimentitalea marina]
MKHISQVLLKHPQLIPVLVIIAVLALPLAVWRDVMAVTDQSIRKQTTALDKVMTTLRSYYSQNVIANLSSEVQTVASHDYHDIEGAIPIPATLAIELGELINATQSDGGFNVEYRFVSDLPFLSRKPFDLTAGESRALTEFRNGFPEDHMFLKADNSPLDHAISMVTPVIMEDSCVACHNTHPDSPKTDWQTGDIRGLQSFTVRQPIFSNLLTFKYLILYMIAAGTFGILFSRHQLRVASKLKIQGEELTENNEFLAGVSMKISRYLSPQVYKSIFSGERDASISTERKKLTVFFSDIKDFTQTTESLQPEELTALLNSYFTEMSAIAERHGATIDKFIGDAIVAFFGDPDSKGTTEDARACVRMALEMQERLGELAGEWRAKGIEHPFRARIGINTGYCNVGNFGSELRMDYTIIGAEANLAARLEASAEPGGIVMSYETYAHVRDIVTARQLPPMRFKGIAREVVPYVIDPGRNSLPASEVSRDGNRVTVHLERLDEVSRARLQQILDDQA